MIRLAVLAALATLASCGQEPTRPTPRPTPEPEPYVETIAPAPSPEIDLGEVPEEIPVRWPAPPQIVRELDANTEAELRAAIAQPGTRVRVHTSISGRLDLEADDLELILDDDARIAHLLVGQAHGRVRVQGGRFGTIELSIPGRHHPPPVRWDPAWRAHDVSLVGVTVEAEDTALFLRGQRVAVIDAQVRAGRYSIWSGDTGDFFSEDLIIARSSFASAGPESTVRLVDVRRAIVVGNVLENTRKHDFRVHGRSELIYFARNRLINTGIMIGSMDEDHVGAVWLVDNALHHTVESLLVVDPSRISRLVATGNHVYSDRWQCFLCGDAPEWFRFADNPMAAFRDAPREAPTTQAPPATGAPR